MADQCDRENESSQIVNFERRPVYEIVKKMQIQDFNAALMEFKDQSMEMQPQRIVLVENPSQQKQIDLTDIGLARCYTPNGCVEGTIGSYIDNREIGNNGDAERSLELQLDAQLVEPTRIRSYTLRNLKIFRHKKEDLKEGKDISLHVA
ncbi:MAG: hypothetical protein EZS28_017606 [Streblomastix strix]|uniref:Uncharacterized protein n=1 Tax=Streblomastix strix TaxID=222440 RepID=A0A5J4VWE6_9EUKA|nr:MAG: hypothetical protein EZS28_017606 [Streblomastix strix]